MIAWRGFARILDRLSIYLPIIMMAMLALGTYWLARNTPSFLPGPKEPPPTHEPDYFLRGFAVKSFDPTGRLKSEIHGAEARHYADTDTMEIDEPRIRSFNEEGAVVVATARRGISNGDGSQVQLIGNAVVTREAAPAKRAEEPKLEIRGEFLHAFMNEERVKSHKPVRLTRGTTVFHGDSLDLDHQKRVLELTGNVRGTLPPSDAAP